MILEVNRWQSPALEGMHDIYYGTAPAAEPRPIPLIRAGDRIGSPHFRCDPDKIVAVVETDAPDRNLPFAPPDEIAQRIAGHILEFFGTRSRKGRLPHALLPLQSGVGNIANAVLARPARAPFEGLTAYTEVIQDGMLDLLECGKLTHGLGHGLLAQPRRGRAAQRTTWSATATSSCCGRRRSATTPR